MSEIDLAVTVDMESKHRGLLTRDIYPIRGDGNSPTSTPTVAIAFELAAMGDRGFDVEYTACEVYNISGANTLDRFVKRIAKRNALLANSSESSPPYGSALSIGALRDATNAQIDMYVLLKLRQKRLQFDRFGNIISTANGSLGYFVDPGLIDRRGNIYYRPNTATDECQLAIFKFLGSRVVYPTGGYSIPFNIHLDFESVSRIGGVRDVSYVPVIIDPDVRDPGGSGPG